MADVPAAANFAPDSAWGPARDASGRFLPGHGGKPRGTISKASRAAQALLAGAAETLAEKAIAEALTGNSALLQFLLGRILPRERVVEIDLPALVAPSDALTAQARIVEALAAGEISASEATALATAIASFSRTAETVELDDRLRELETNNALRH